MNFRTVTALTLLGMTAAVAGCGRNEEDTFALVPVDGTVTLDGKPLEGVTIAFVSDASNKPKTDGGDITGPGGTFKAKYRNRDGLAPGKYKVVVSRPPSKGSGLPDAIAKDPMQAEIAQQAAGSGTPGKGKNAGPAPWPYESAGKSPFSQEISSKGERGLTFDCKSTMK